MTVHKPSDATQRPAKRDLLTRINEEGVCIAEGYLFELERRGYLASGEFVPEVALEHPEALENAHRDFQFAGSDVVEAFTYNGHREKMRVIGKEDLLEKLNRAALRIAKKVADNPPPGMEPNLMAGNISNSNIWNPEKPETFDEVRMMFDEMVTWAKEEQADFIIGETFYYAEEAYCALESIKEAGMTAVLTIAVMASGKMQDGVDVVECCKELERRGATVVGLNCFRGPNTMMPLLKNIREAVSCPVAALPLAYRTTDSAPAFFNLPDNNGCTVPAPHGRTFPTALDPLYCNRYEIRDFAEKAWAMGVRYLGVCCGNNPMLTREVAMAMGKTPGSMRYAEKMTNHFLYGENERIPEHMKELGRIA